jgi:GNAT superfamily N-acetyltransferase
MKCNEIDEKNFKLVPEQCRCCLYWQTTGPYGESKLEPMNEKEKKKWLHHVLTDFGSCMKVYCLNNTPIGFVQYALPKFFPRVKEYGSSPADKDAVFIACLYLPNKETRGKGLGTIMLNDLLTELRRRHVKAIETFARKDSTENPSGPLKFYLKHGFAIRSDEDNFPLVRLDLVY